MPVPEDSVTSLTIWASCFQCVNTIEIKKNYEANATASFEINIDGNRSDYVAALDRYDLLSPGTVGLDVYISGNTINNTFSTFINGQLFKADIPLNFPWLALSHINAINLGGTVGIARLNKLEFDQIWLQILQEDDHLPKVRI